MRPRCMNRWPRLVRPLRTLPTLKGTTALPKSARTQTMGRAKEIGSSAQRMLFGKGVARMAAGRIVFRTVAAAPPVSVTTALRYSPFGVETTPSLPTGTPTFSANLSAAVVGRPSGS